MIDRALAAKIDEYIESCRDEIIADLDELVRIPSVAIPGSPEPMPFGPDVAKVLDAGLKMAEKHGMKAENHGNWYGLARRGEGKHSIGIFAHLDVVEAVGDWLYPAFETTEKDGWLIGRGTSDDKNAAIVGYYVSKVLDKFGLAGNTELLLYLGCCEEKGMSDIDRYLSENEEPDFSMVPDFIFPVSVGETGSVKFTLTPNEKFNELCCFDGGKPGARVPLSASVIYTGAKADVISAAAADVANISTETAEAGLKITATGKPASTMGATDSINAIGALCSFLSGSDVLEGSDKAIIADIAQMSDTTDGECFGIATSSPLFGALTCTCLLAKENNGTDLTFTCRYPESTTGAAIADKLAAYAAAHNMKLNIVSTSEPKFIAPDDDRVSILCDAWNDVSGKTMGPRVGGSTYSRKLKNGVSYGPKFGPGCPFLPAGHGMLHSPDEAVNIQGLLDAIKVYVRAVVGLDEYYAGKN